MQTTKSRLIRLARKTHRFLMWVAFVALLVYIISAITHPLMVWTGPKPQSYFPPGMTFDQEQLGRIPEALKHNGITEAQQIKIIASETKPLLQISVDANAVRQYVDLDTLELLDGQDALQAIWLARYYSGLDTIASIDRLTEFTDSYPWVNRLLPVYKVTFADADETTLYVHTETNQLASISNQWKSWNRTLFLNLHTLSVLDDYPVLRVAVISLLIIAMLTMLLTGVYLLFVLKRKRMPSVSSRLHRILAYVLFVPFAFLLISGLYHLYFSEFSDNQRGLQLFAQKPLIVDALAVDFSTSAVAIPDSLNEVALLPLDNGQWVYRLSGSVDKAHQSHDAGHHFSGQVKEQAVSYIDAVTTEVLVIEETRQALDMAQRYRDFPTDAVIAVEKVTRFGLDYDFRNKRLPVYRIKLAEPFNETLFIDTRSAILVDTVNSKAKLEGLSFSLLHKWNFLRPIMPAIWRDIIVVSVLGLLLILSVLGVIMRFRR